MPGGAICAQLTPIIANVTWHELIESNSSVTGHWQVALAWLSLPAFFALMTVLVNIRSSSPRQKTKQPSVYICHTLSHMLLTSLSDSSHLVINAPRVYFIGITFLIKHMHLKLI